MSAGGNGGERVTVLIPVYDDWESVALLLPLLDEAIRDHGPVEVLLVDDGSVEPPPAALEGFRPTAVARVRCLRLRRNLGHQRAIAIGLGWISATADPPAVVVMDGDGEDAPGDVPRLIDECSRLGGKRVVFAARRRRSESLVFRVFYYLYRMVHRVFIGHSVRVGNFSIVPRACLQRLIVVSDLWNHYAASVFKARLPRAEIATTRGRRLVGKSTMNFVSLVTHGLSALSVFGETLGTRLLILSCLLIVASSIGIGVIAVVVLTGAATLPAWTPLAVVLFVVIFFQALFGSLLFAFINLGGRSDIGFLPIRDHEFFVLGVEDIDVGAATDGTS